MGKIEEIQQEPLIRCVAIYPNGEKKIRHFPDDEGGLKAAVRWEWEQMQAGATLSWNITATIKRRVRSTLPRIGYLSNYRRNNLNLTVIPLRGGDQPHSPVIQEIIPGPVDQHHYPVTKTDQLIDVHD